MSSLPAALVALILIWSAGFGAVVFVFKSEREVNALEFAALAWFFGATIVSLLLWIFSFAISGVALQIVISAICVALAVFSIAKIRRGPLRFHWSRPRDKIEIALSALLGLEIAVVFFLSLRHTLGWDGLLIWELKARVAWLNGGALPPQYFIDLARGFSHPEYPLFLPLNEMWLYQWMGEPNQYWLKLIFPIFYAAGMILLARAAADLTGKRWIGLLVASLFLFVPWIFSGPGGIVVGYADVPLGLFYLAAIYYLMIFMRRNGSAALIILLALNSALPWIKREGVILWLTLGICGGYAIWKRRGLLLAALALFPGALIAIAFRLYLRYMRAPAALDFIPVSWSAFRSHLDRTIPILRELFEEMSIFSHWSLLWWIVLFAFVAAVVRGQMRTAALFLFFTGVPLALYCSTYFFSAWPDFVGHIESSLPRLLIQLIPTAWLVVALALAPRDAARAPND